MKEEKKVPELRFKEFEGDYNKTSFAKFVQFFNGYAFSSNDSVDQGCRWIKIADVGVNGMNDDSQSFLPKEYAKEYSRFLLKEGDYVIALTRPILNKQLKIAKLKERHNDSLLNQRVAKIISDNEIDYVYQFLLQYKITSKIENRIAGTDPPNLSPKEVNSIVIHIPSLPEQEKIAAFLSSVDAKSSQLQRKKQLLEQYKKCIMQKLFSKEIRFKKEDGSDFPDWEEKKLGEIAGPVKTKNKDNNINFVLTNSATQGIISQEDYFDRDIANHGNLDNYYIVSKDDFVYNPRISVHAPVGPIKRNKLKEGVMSPLYNVFRFEEDNLSFFEFYFETSFWFKHLQSVANYGARHDRMNISQKDFFDMPIPFPSEGERNLITDFLNSISQKFEATKLQLSKAQEFKKGLLQKMFV